MPPTKFDLLCEVFAPATDSCAVLVFARTPGCELRERRRQVGLRTFSAIHHHVLKVVRSSGLPYYILNEEAQVGTGFGQRLQNAIDQVLAQGYSRVIVVGGDCPHLESNLLLRAAESLMRGAAPIGRDRRGGVYLFGVTREQHEVLRKRKLPWQTAQLATCLVQSLQSSSDIFELPHFGDVHSRQDLHRALALMRNRQLARFLLSTLAGEVKPTDSQPLHLSSWDGTFSATRRGPPLAALAA